MATSPWETWLGLEDAKRQRRREGNKDATEFFGCKSRTNDIEADKECFEIGVSSVEERIQHRKSSALALVKHVATSFSSVVFLSQRIQH